MQGNPETIVEATSFLILPEIRLNSLVSTVLLPAQPSSTLFLFLLNARESSEWREEGTCSHNVMLGLWWRRDGGDDDDNNTNLRRLIRALSDVVLGTCWVELLSLLCVHLAVAT